LVSLFWVEFGDGHCTVQAEGKLMGMWVVLCCVLCTLWYRVWKVSVWQCMRLHVRVYILQDGVQHHLTGSAGEQVVVFCWLCILPFGACLLIVLVVPGMLRASVGGGVCTRLALENLCGGGACLQLIYVG